ncbi:MAG TPA: flagellin [Polyangiaceae bacterium]|nr:flagellin [Polyangiaceae bacterium]
MALIIPPHTSSSPLEQQHRLNETGKTTGKLVERVASQPSGQGTATDGEGLAISDALRIQIRSLALVERNANEVISMAQTADGALGQMGGLLEQMRDLVQKDSSAEGGDHGPDDATVEFSKLQAEVDRIQKAATYDGRALLGAEAVDVGVDVGTEGASDRLAITLGGLAPLTVLTASDHTAGATGRASGAVVGRIDDALAAITGQRARFGAAVNRFSDTTAAVQTARANRAAGSAPIGSADAAEALALLCKTKLLAQAPTTVSAQTSQLSAHAVSLLQD